MIRFATVGTSPITDNVIEVIHEHPGATFVGTVSRDAERGARFTAEHGGERAFPTVEQAASAPDIDAVYLGSPNACHAEQALACIAAGKHVLIEKPVCACAREAREVFSASRAAGVVALEAMRPLHDPAFARARELFRELGPIRRACIRFGKYSSRYDDILGGRPSNIFDCELASGALMDIGVYCIEPALALFEKPRAITASAALLDRSTRPLTHGPIDGAGDALLSYDGFTASVHWSKITQDFASTQIEGERATLTLDSISTPTAARIDYLGNAGRQDAKYSAAGVAERTERIELPHVANSMCYELSDFLGAIEAVREGGDIESAPCGPLGTLGQLQDLSIAALEFMDEIRRQIGVTFPADAA